MRLFTVTGSFFYGALDADISQRIQNRNDEKPIFVGNIYTKKLIQNGKSRGTVRKDVDDDLMMEYFLAVTDRFNQR